MEFPKFTKEMKKTHKILVPMMLPIHFEMLEHIFKKDGYQIEVLKTNHQKIIDEGLKNVHNDTCYPALLVIGQLIDALKSGKYDVDHVALAITQTGGGCRASNYYFLLRKALVQAGFPQVPVIAINFQKLNKENDGFQITLSSGLRLVYACLYGDALLWLKNQCKPYELNRGETDRLVSKWISNINKQLDSMAFMRLSHNYKQMVKDFANIKRHRAKKIKVGVVGEIYMKYAPLGNNNLEQFLIDEGCEPVVSGVIDFGLYCIQNNIIDFEYYDYNKKSHKTLQLALDYVVRLQQKLIKIIKKDGNFIPPDHFKEVFENHEGMINKGVKMGEGWLLTAEMVTLLKTGVNNIVCCQPFGCLPNHIIAKGMARKVKNFYPQANIVAIDYDPSATKVNQENRLKLMLSNAKLQEHFK